MDGIVIKYKEGKLVGENEYLNGKLIKEKQNDENGRIIIFEGTISNNKPENGIKREFHENGSLYYEQKYKNGKVEKLKEYYENGILCCKKEYKNGKEEKIKEYFENGKISFDCEFKNNYPWNLKEFDEQGNLINDIKDGKGLMKYFNDNKNLVFESELLNGQGNGKGKFYHAGEIVFEGEFQMGKFGKEKEKYMKIIY